MNTYGLIGYPLSHSFSKGFFTEKFENDGTSKLNCYHSFPLETIADFPKLIQDTPGLKGLNVTIPYKEKVIPYLTKLDETAAAVGAVNTICFDGNERIGFNTDVIGFGRTLDAFMANSGGPAKQALILGTGGAAKAVEYVFSQRKIPFIYISRTPGENRLTYNDLSEDIMATHDLIVNTTPLGMFPNIDSCPDIPYNCLDNRHRLYDLLYNPPQTLFLKKGLKAGASVHNGLEMLHEQAIASWELWNPPSN